MEKYEAMKKSLTSTMFENEKLKIQMERIRNNKDKLYDEIEEFKRETYRKIRDQDEIIMFQQHELSSAKHKQTETEKERERALLLVKELKQKVEDAENVIHDQPNSNEKLHDQKMEIALLREQLHSLHEFKIYKNKIENELSACRNMLENEAGLREERESELERKYLTERERLKKEMIQKMRETKLRLLEMTEDQLHTTTKRTILENEQMTIELQYQSKETEKLLKCIKKYQEENQVMKREIEIHKHVQNTMATRTHFLSKLVDQLNGRFAKLEVELSNAEDELHHAQSELERRNNSGNIRKIRQEMYAQAEVAINKCHAKIKSLKKERDYHKKQCKRYLDMQDDAAVFIWKCLETCRAELDSNISITDIDSLVQIVPSKILPIDELTLKEREILLKKLFDKISGFNVDSIHYATEDEKQLRCQSETELSELPKIKRNTRMTTIISRSSHGHRKGNSIFRNAGSARGIISLTRHRKQRSSLQY